MKKTFLLLFLLIIVNTSLIAQSSDSIISVTAQGEERVAANLILFQINLNRFNKEAQTAFHEHKELEKFLTQLLIEEGIESENIVANPITIYPSGRHQNDSGFETRQQVSIKMDDVTQFEEMQLALINNGFDSFTGTFNSSEREKAQDKALENAVKEATRKAEILAGASGRVISEVVEIAYGTPSNGFPRREAADFMVSAASGSLLQFERTIPVQEQVRVVFSLK